MQKNRKYRGAVEPQRKRVPAIMLAVTLLCFVWVNSPIAAQQSTIKSLRQSLNRDIDDTARVNILNKLSAELLESAPDSAMAAAMDALVLAKLTGYPGGEADALNRVGQVDQFQYRYRKALQNYEQSLTISEELEDMERVVDALNRIAFIHRNQGQYESAMQTYQRSLTIADELGNREATAVALAGIGAIHSYQERYNKALEYFAKSLAIQEELDNTRAIITLLNQIGNKQVHYGRYEEALQNHERALELARELGDRRGIQQTLAFIGIFYRSQDKDREALRYYKRSLRMAEELGDARAEALGLNLLGDLYARRGENKNAVAMWKKAYALLESIGDIHLLMSVAHWLSGAYSETGDFKNAYYYEKVKSTLSDSLLNVENVKSVTEMSAKYEAEKREQQIALLQKDKELQLVVNYAMIGGFVLLCILAVGLFHRYRYRKRTGEELQNSYDELKRTQQQLIHAEKMATLGELTAGVAHEIKNPLNFITNFSGMNEELAAEIEEQAGDNEELREALELLKSNTAKIREHGSRADRIVNGMLMHSRETKGVRHSADINALVTEAVELARHGAASGRDVEIQLELSPETGSAEVLPAEISRVVLNLVANAMYAARKHCELAGCNPTVTVGTSRSNGQVIIRVADNGVGIIPEVREKMFQPFFTTKPTGDGTGLGLSLSWDIVTNGHNGTIEVESKEAEGSTFIVKLPLV